MMSDNTRKTFRSLENKETPSPVEAARDLSRELDALENKVLLEVATMREMLLGMPEEPIDENNIDALRQTMDKAFQRLAKMKEDIFMGIDKLDSNIPRPPAPVADSDDVKTNADLDSFLFKYLTDLKKL